MKVGSCRYLEPDLARGESLSEWMGGPIQVGVWSPHFDPNIASDLFHSTATTGSGRPRSSHYSYAIDCTGESGTCLAYCLLISSRTFLSIVASALEPTAVASIGCTKGSRVHGRSRDQPQPRVVPPTSYQQDRA